MQNTNNREQFVQQNPMTDAERAFLQRAGIAFGLIAVSLFTALGLQSFDKGTADSSNPNAALVTESPTTSEIDIPEIVRLPIAPVAQPNAYATQEAGMHTNQEKPAAAVAPTPSPKN